MHTILYGRATLAINETFVCFLFFIFVFVKNNIKPIVCINCQETFLPFQYFHFYEKQAMHKCFLLLVIWTMLIKIITHILLHPCHTQKITSHTFFAYIDSEKNVLLLGIIYSDKCVPHGSHKINK